MPEIDNIRVLLAARAGVYRTLQNMLGNEPSTEMLEQLCGEATQSVFLLFDTGQDDYLQVLENCFARAAEYLEGGAEALYKLEGCFTRLFVGPGGLEGNPWESFFLSKDKTIRQGVTLEVRKAYVAQGFIPEAYPNVSDDHVAIELDFLTKLAMRAEEAWAHGSAAKTLEALIASEAFLREHLMRWASLFTAELRGARHGAPFYLEAAAVLEAFLPLDLEALADLQSTLQE